MSLNSNRLMNLFSETGALLKGHFELSSGKHSDEYFQCALVLQFPQHCELLAKMLREKFKDEKITCVVGPALGGVTIAYELARQLDCRSVFAERKEGRMQLRRGFELSNTDNVLIVEDVITTGGSVLEVTDLINNLEVSIAGLACIVDRSGGNFKSLYRFISLLQINPKIFDPRACSLCKEGISLQKPGSKKTIS